MKAKNLLAERRIAPRGPLPSAVSEPAPQDRCRPVVGVRVLTIDKVIRGETQHLSHRTWRREAVAWLPNQDLAAEAAMAWFEETDQSFECELAIRVEDQVPNAEIVRVIVGPQVVAKVVSRTLLGGGDR
jgi:hypothetical protein